ncbi:MAG TPA: cell division protein FtsZ, partial [Terriglobia bacterium]|nr:cell division protein FtsZ [Terriglobia bacterium]
EDASINGARGILINVTGSSSLMLQEVHAASSIIEQAAHDDANIIFGAVLDENMKESVKITVIATGFKPETMRAQRRADPPQAAEPAAPAPSPHAPAGPREPVVWQGITPIPSNAAIPHPLRSDDLEIPAFLRMKAK